MWGRGTGGMVPGKAGSVVMHEGKGMVAGGKGTPPGSTQAWNWAVDLLNCGITGRDYRYPVCGIRCNRDNHPQRGVW